MNPKTEEAIAEVLEDLDLRLKFNRDEALAKICAIVEKEREQEVDFGVHKVKKDGTLHMTEWRYYIPEYTGRKIHIVGLPDQEGK